MITKEQSKEMFHQVRSAIRHLLIEISDVTWKHLRKYEINLNVEPETNVANFLNTNGIATLFEDLYKTGGNIDDEARSKDYAIIVTLITAYMYLYQSTIIYTDDRSNYVKDAEIFDIITDFIGKSAKQKFFEERDYEDIIDYMYDLDDEILRIRETQRNTRYINFPFMLVVSEDNGEKLNISAMNFGRNDFISYFTMNTHGILITAMSRADSKMKDIIFEELGLTDNNKYHPVILSGGYAAFAFKWAGDSLKETAANSIENGNTMYKNYQRICKTRTEKEKITFVATTASSALIIMNNMYMTHKALEAYINRTPEVKTKLERIGRMTEDSLKRLEEEYPTIQALVYTKYEYINESEYEPKGGHHASPCEHERSSTMRYNPKTGEKDIYVRGCTVNKGKPKTHYYDNRKKAAEG